MEEGIKKIMLAGFNLDVAEKAIVENMLKNYQGKLEEHGGFERLQMRLRRSQKGKVVMHEIEGILKVKNKNFNSQAFDYNLFAALDAVLEKLLNELIHTQRTRRQEK